MNSYKPSLEMAVPRTPDVRHEIMKAIRALAAQDDGERLRQRRAAIASIRREIEDIARDVRKLQREWPSLILSELRKSGYDPNEPRVPAGHPDGGQWTNGDEGGLSDDSAVRSSRVAERPSTLGIRYAALDAGTQSDAINGPLGVQYSGGIEDEENESPGGQQFEGTPAQLARQAIALGRWQQVFSQVQRYDPAWRAGPTLVDPNSIEGDIAKLKAWTEEGEEYLSRLRALGFSRDPNTGDLISSPAAKTGNPFIDYTTEKLMDILSRVITKIGPRPDLDSAKYGIQVHAQFSAEVRGAGLHGIEVDDVERTFGVEENASYGDKGGIRPDAVLRDDDGKVVAIYDVKTGSGFTKQQVVRYRLRTGSDSHVPLFELRPNRVTVCKVRTLRKILPEFDLRTIVAAREF